MKYQKTTFILLLTFASILGKSQEKLAVDKSKPNAMYILADDLGYGDLSCYGQEKFSTPNKEWFTQHYSGAAVCAPSRSALMTNYYTGQLPTVQY